MAGFVGYRKNTWDNASAAQRAVLRTVINQLELGDPVLGTIGGVEWYVFHSAKINPRFVENLAWFNTVLASITTAPVRDYPTTDQDGEPLGDPLTLAADAQGAVAWFAAASDLPASWTPVSGVE